MKTFIRFSLTAVAAFAAAVIGTCVAAQDVRITTFKGQSNYSLNGREFSVSRDQNPDARIQGDFARTSRLCPPNCIQPMTAAAGVITVGELEVINFLETTLSEGRGLLIDARTPEAFRATTIPGAVNVPHTTLAPDNRYRTDILRALGAVDTTDGGLNFDTVLTLVIYSGGPWSPDAVEAVTYLVDAGYPPEKLMFYRGGMQGWAQLGLTTLATQNPG